MDGATRSTTLRMNPSGTAPLSRASSVAFTAPQPSCPEDDDERHVEHVNRVLDGTEHRIVEHVTCSAHDEHVAETLVEDDLRGYARITATEQHRCGVLPIDEFRAVRDSLAGVNGRVVDKSLVAFAKGLPSGNGA